MIDVMIVCLAVDGDAAELTTIDAHGLLSLRPAVVDRAQGGSYTPLHSRPIMQQHPIHHAE